MLDSRALTTASTASRTPILDREEPLPEPKPPISSSARLLIGVVSGVVTAVVLMFGPRLPHIDFGEIVGRLGAWGIVGLFAAIIAAIFVAVAVHEAGHAVLGALAGFRVHSIRIWRLELHWPFKLAIYRGTKSGAGGWVVCSPVGTDNLAARAALMMIGGPGANFASAALVYLLPYQKGIFSDIFIVVSLLLGIVNLVPLRSGGMLSDGRRVLMVLSDRARGARWLAMLKLVTDMIDGVAPADLSPEFIAVAVAVDDDSPDTLSAHLIAYSSADHRHEHDEAARLLEVALRHADIAPPMMRQALATEAAVFQARRRRRVDLAEQWFAAIPEKTEMPWLRTVGEGALLEGRGDIAGAFAKLDGAERVIRAWPNPIQQKLSLAALERWRSELPAAT